MEINNMAMVPFRVVGPAALSGLVRIAYAVLLPKIPYVRPKPPVTMPSAATRAAMMPQSRSPNKLPPILLCQCIFIL